MRLNFSFLDWAASILNASLEGSPSDALGFMRWGGTYPGGKSELLGRIGLILGKYLETECWLKGLGLVGVNIGGVWWILFRIMSNLESN